MPDQDEQFTVVFALNQFFGGLGGEEQADLSPQWYPGARGPAIPWQKLAGEPFTVAGTLVFGDNHAAAHPAEDVDQMLNLLKENLPSGAPDLLIAGPAFLAGRYGMTCGALCQAAHEHLGLPVLTAMSPDNPGVPLYRRSIPIIETADNVIGMTDALSALARAARHLQAGNALDPSRDGLLPRGVRENTFSEESGARRALEMLLRKMAGEPIHTEYEMPRFDRVPPAAPLADAGRATIALVTSGGIVPRGNPDRIESASASRFGEYALDGLDRLDTETHQTVHGGYDPTYANADPNRVLPLDQARVLEREGRIGRLHHSYFATVGNATSVERARGFGEEIAGRLKEAGVQAVILTST